MRHLTEISDFSVEEISQLISVSRDIMTTPQSYIDSMRGKVMATLFYEPSTRTKFSFEAAMQRLGGSVIGFAGAENTSVAKGETLSDTVRMVSAYADLIVMRHYIAGAPMQSAKISEVPVINAGDGGNQHPTQTLTDLVTISREMGRLDNLRIAVAGDLKYGRTVHSLVKAMVRYPGNKFYFVSPEELKMPDYVKELLSEGQYEEVQSLEDVLGDSDVLYMTRIQKERFEDVREYDRLNGTYILDAEKMKSASENMIVMHPLPRVNEITEEVDSDPRAKYFQQAKYGMYARMALILMLEDMKKRGQHDTN
ncbi:MAG: aspartate carbamoyltransferase [Clostridia bacterium]|nr:aspartate carbamoyltransferase [Clostridia bacterium]